jgi:hypothetical protein
MALSTVLASLEGIDDAVKGLYKEVDGSFILDLDGIDDHPSVKGMKSALETIKGKRDEAKTEAERLALEKKEDEIKRATESQEFKTLYDSSQTELSALREESSTFKKSVQDKDIRLALISLAAEATDSAAKQKDIVDLYKKYAIIGENGVEYQVGGIAVDGAKIIEMVKKERPYLADGSKADGGGANGSGGGAQTKTWTEMSEIEKTELFKSDKPSYDRLKAAAPKKGY